MSRYLRHVVLGLLLLPLWGVAQSMSVPVADANSYPLLTNAAQVRGLSSGEAAKKIPVRIRGVVLDNNRSGQFSILDGKTGLYAMASVNLVTNFVRGDLIQVDGVTDPGKFAPYIDVSAVQKLGTGTIPMPPPANPDDLLSGRLDAQWVEVSGVVRRVESVKGAWVLEVKVENGDGRILVFTVGAEPDVTVDALVRLRGVCYYQFNLTRQVVRPYLVIPEGEPILVKEPAVTNLAALPVRSVGSLMQFSIETHVHRVRLHGVVICFRPGEGLWIRDGGYGMHVVCIDDDPLAVGTEVDVFGFLKRSEYGPLIEDAIVRKTGSELPVAPIQLSKASDALNHDADLVACPAVIQERWQALDGIRLKLSDGATEFPAVLHLADYSKAPNNWLPGARVRVAGICRVGFLTETMMPGTFEPSSFQLLLRSPQDITVLQAPPWWNAEHLAWLGGAMVAGLLLVVGMVVWIGRRRLRAEALERMKSEAEFSAVWNERNRMARELHDTLAQGLGTISLQLELAKRQLPPDSNARSTLEEAGSQTRASLDEVRSAIWNMRSQVLETGDLASALNGVLHSMVDHNCVQSELRVVGESKRFAPRVENNLLRIGQEAIANAAKYARAKRIEVVLKFEKGQFEMEVNDDGLGFDPAHPPVSEGGFGLVGISERAAEINATLTVTSAPGKGCAIKLVLPGSKA